jgi:hypothetical protein
MKPKVTTIPQWSADLAYVVGLIATDGCLSRDGRHITMTSQDLDVINHVKDILCSNAKIGYTINKTSRAYRVQIGNVTLYRWFESIGIHAAKSRTIGEIYIPNKYFVDFLRGHLEGDGSITVYTDTYNTFKNPRYIYTRLFVRFLSGSKVHIEWLHEKIKEILQLNGRLYQIPCRKYEPVYIIKFGKKESIILLNKIYYCSNIPSMQRKRTIAQKFLYQQKT